MIPREDLVVQSVTDFGKAKLLEKGYAQDLWRWEEAWSAEVMASFDRSVIAAGFNFDDGGRQAELGSDLKTRVYHVEFYVFGKTMTLAQQLAGALKFGLESEGRIPLGDYAQDPVVTIDQLVVLAVTSHRHPERTDPEPWEEFVWVTAVQVEDTYQARLA